MITNQTRVYISGHCPKQARELEARLRTDGYEVVSRWHDDDAKPASPAAWCSAAGDNLHRLGRADLLVLIADDAAVPGGKFFEAGAAVAKGKCVFVLGRRENGMLHHPRVRAFADYRALEQGIREDYRDTAP